MIVPNETQKDVFNISTEDSSTVFELAEVIWEKIKPGTPFRYTSDKPFAYDVQRRVPDCRKARKVLGFEAATKLPEILDEVIPWVKEQIALNNI